MQHVSVPLSIDSSIQARPDLAAAEQRGSAEVAPRDRQAFAGVLARAQHGAAPGGTPRGLVAATRTQLSTAQASSALRTAWEQTVGRPPSDRTLSILVGQWAHETGRGASMLNYNFGGIKGTGPSGMSAVYQTREGWGETEVRVRDQFRAYGSAEEGATDYVSLLARRYPDAIGAAERGDPRSFVQALKARGYFTGNEASYIKSVTSLSNQALAGGLDGASPSGAAEGGALASLPLEYSASSVAPFARFEPGSFADEVSRAALLMSALRIGQSPERDG